MKLGTQTGSVTNHVFGRMTKGQPTPEVGMGATLLGWTDRHAATITKVWQERGFTWIEVKRDYAKVIKGSVYLGNAEYEYSPDAEAGAHTFRAKGADGKWQAVFLAETGRWRTTDTGLRIGERETYRDPSF